MITFEEVKRIIESDPCDNIKWARKYNKKLLLHVEGIGKDEYLARINNYENETQFLARKKHAISNKFVTEELLRPTDNVFNARGGSKQYKFSSDKTNDFINILTNINDGLSLSEYIEQIWFKKFITDPNGLIFLEVKEIEGEEYETILEPTYKSIQHIRDYKQNGINIDYVVFEPHKKIIEDNTGNKEEKEYFWVVDESFYYLYEKGKQGLIEIKRIENSFELVPAVLCSNIIDNITGMKLSPIDSQIELLDKYLVSNSVLSIAEFLHNYPQQWMYVDECSYCDGTGEINGETCPHCNGSKQATRKDVTDIIKLRIPKDDQQKIAPDISGFLSLPTEPMEMMVNSVSRTWDLIYFSHWGTVVSKSATNETATGRFLDAQPVNNRLNKYSKATELIHSSLANLYGLFYYPETFEKAYIQYGRRYLIETPDQIWEKYLNAKKENAPVSVLDLLLSQFIESEFRENEQLYIYETKKSKLEPFVHWDILTVKDLGLSQEDYKNKLFFNEWINTLSIDYIIKTELEKLKEELNMFVSKKQLLIINTNNNE
ncbi:MAG: hypothetical protein ACOWWH_12615 [Eubacteriaceae bacterium]